MPDRLKTPTLLLAASLGLARATRPSILPSSIPDPLAYYYLNDGTGWNLRESVTNNATAGYVTYEDTSSHPENANYVEPNWTSDEYFGNTIQCGRADTWQKDTLSLADVDYGHSGRWAMSVWFRHDPENFPGYSREQFIGHGDPIRPTSTNNQFHVQLERSSRIRTIMRDSTDIDRCARAFCRPRLFAPHTHPQPRL